MNHTNRKSKRIQALIGSALPLLLIGSLQADTSLAAERPDFSGSWQLNEELSENPHDEMMEKMGGGRGRGGGGRSGGGMQGGGGGRGSGGGGREEMQSRMNERVEKVRVLEILHQDPELVIGFADGTSRTLFTDGRETAEDLEAGFFEGTAKWKGNSQVVFRSESTNGGKTAETYELNPAADMLWVTTKMDGDGRRPTISFKRVYYRASMDVPAEPDPEGLTGSEPLL